MFVDEFGAIRRPTDGRPPLPINSAATEIYLEASRQRGDDTADAPSIHGPAVVALRSVWS